MKNNRVKILLLCRALLLLSLILLQLSCRQDDTYSPSSGNALVSLTVSASGVGMGTSGNGIDAASGIKSLCILQFMVKNQTGDENTDLANSTLSFVNVAQKADINLSKFNVSLKYSGTDSERYIYVVLANMPNGYGFLQGLSDMTYANVQKNIANSVATTTNLSFDDMTPFPMFGLLNNGNPSLINENTSSSFNISLLRAVARVDVGIGSPTVDGSGEITSWEKGSVPFKINSIRIYKSADQYSYLPVAENIIFTGSPTIDSWSINKPSVVVGAGKRTGVYEGPVINNDNQSSYCSNQIFLPETSMDWGSVYDNLHTDRCAVVVGGFYSNSNVETFYRMDFTADNGSDKLSLLRNHVYRFAITGVTNSGYSNPDDAYNSKPVGLTFIATLESWTAGVKNEVPSLIGYGIVYDGLNGKVLTINNNDNTSLTIPKKSEYWFDGSKPKFDYDKFYGEARYNIATFIGDPERRNGTVYTSVEDAFKYEGAAPSLLVSPDDVDEANSVAVTFPWKSSVGELKAFDICRAYTGYGYTDWRLPRLSELALIHSNRKSLEMMKGFIAMDGSYWSGSECNLLSPSTGDGATEAYAIDFTSNATSFFKNISKTTDNVCHIRCVRSVKSTD